MNIMMEVQRKRAWEIDYINNIKYTVSSTTTTNEDIKVNLTTPTEYTIEYKN